MFNNLVFGLAFQATYSILSTISEKLVALASIFRSNISYFLSKKYPLEILFLKIIYIFFCQTTLIS